MSGFVLLIMPGAVRMDADLRGIMGALAGVETLGIDRQKSKKLHFCNSL
jgi:hypothetical protein